ncbi:MAG: FadR family transcriptional regulator [Fimbriimonadaceae bacterium]|nr:FadR family transcriptional regulator [Alphaproteobacteria bacterium]
MFQPSDKSGKKTSVGLIQQIADSVRDQIIYGQLEVGQRLPAERELARRFNASEPTVREAMKLLAAQHLIYSKRGPKGGIFVNRPTIEQGNNLLTSVTIWLVTLGVFSLEDIIEARRYLGQACVQLAAQRRSDKDVEILERELRRMSDSSLSNEEFFAADAQFHRAIVNAAGNKVLQMVMLIISDSLKPATNMMVFRFRERETMVEFNSRILAAIRSRRVGPCEETFRELIDYLIERYANADQEAGIRNRVRHLRAVK